MLEAFYNLLEEQTILNRIIIISTIVIILVIVIVIAIAIIEFIVKKSIERSNELYAILVKDTSLRYKDVLNINSRYDFFDLREEYTYFKSHNSKVQFDRFDYTKYLEELIERDKDFFELVLKATVENNVLMEQYETELMNISPFADKDTFDIKGMSFSKYRKMEEKVVSNTILDPVLAPKVIIESAYVSPKGRNSYHDSRMFSCSKLAEEYNVVCDNLERRENKGYQRKIMTDSLRYDIMKRDGFRCVLCGRSARDGVKLHVDHIKPVSKGGKTIPDNLRTLCDTCNFGKSDKYDEYGDN